MSIVILQTFKAVEGRYAELAGALTAMLPDTAARAGAEFVHAAGDAAAGVVTIYEQWDRAESLQAYVAWRTENTDVSALMALLESPPKIEQLACLY